MKFVTPSPFTFKFLFMGREKSAKIAKFFKFFPSHLFEENCHIDANDACRMNAMQVLSLSTFKFVAFARTFRPFCKKISKICNPSKNDEGKKNMKLTRNLSMYK